MTSPASPLFDSMVASLQPGSPMRRSHGRPGRREVQTALPSLATVVSEPITTKQLTDDERDIIAQMGGTVARLLLQMMHDEKPATR